MDADLELMRTTFWMKDLPKSTLVKEVSKMISGGDYQMAKVWIEDNLMPQKWYSEFQPKKAGRGRKGVTCRFGPPTEAVRKETWGNNNV